MDFKTEKNRIYLNNEKDEMIAEVIFQEVSPSVVDISRTFVDDSLRGRGMADKLLQAAVSKLQDEGRKAIPTCSYAVKWFEKHPEHEALLEKQQK